MTSDPIYISRPLLTVLLEIATDAVPNRANVYLLQSAAGDLEPLAAGDSGTVADGQSVSSIQLSQLAPETPVFSDFYFPDVGNSLDFVFGVDLGTPAGQTQGRFLSHPDGNPELSVRDDLHATVLVAVPPWRPANVDAYDRDSTIRQLGVVVAGTPDTDFQG